MNYKQRGMTFFGLPMALMMFLFVALILFLLWAGFSNKVPFLSNFVSGVFSIF